MLEMSVLTEADDLQAVTDAVMVRHDIDPRRVFLMGSSQGGFVSSYVAGKRPQDVRGLILLYPAYVLQAGLKNAGDVDIDSLPETFNIGGLTVGRKYILDAALPEFLYPLNLLLWSGAFHLLDRQILKDNPAATKDSSTRLFDRVFMYGGYVLCMLLVFVYPPLSLCIIGAVSVVMIVRIFTAKGA